MAVDRQNTRQKSIAVLLKYSGIAILATVVTICVAVALGYLFPWKPHVEFSKEVLDEKGNLMHAFLSSDDKWRLKTSLNQADSLYLEMLISKEDQYFWYHPGVNPLAMIRALTQNLLTGKRVSGASTLTMQVVRLLKKRPRTYASKVAEVWEALRLEGALSKEEILELYISLCPFGGNVEGYRSANLLYWNTDGRHISAAQCAALTLIPNQPQQFHPVRKPVALTEKRNQFLTAFAVQTSNFPLQEALAEPVNANYYTIPQLAPQLALRLMKQFPHEQRLHSPINQHWQYQVENLSKAYVRKLVAYHIFNASILVIENRTGKVKVYMGSQEFDDSEHAGQMDGIAAIRSPGSTLKPFLYAGLMDAGKLIPDQILYDVPMHFDGFAPENSDYLFHGQVSASEALLQSLNVPAVYLLHQLGTDQFINQLELLGFQSLQAQRSRIGYSLVLGGCGVKLEELVASYSCLSNGGTSTRLSWLATEPGNPGSTLLSPEACWLVGDMLAGWRRTFSAQTRKGKNVASGISWKTGTSFGKKDAWSLGFNQEYTVGVWLGNFDGGPSAAITGTDIATPLMLQVFNLLPKSEKKPQKPAKLEVRTLCKLTGLPADTFCHQTQNGYWLPNTGLPKCKHLMQVTTDAIQNAVYCPACKLPNHTYKTIWIANPDPAYLRFLRAQQKPIPTVPPHAEHCPVLGQMMPSRLTSPVEGKLYLIDGKTFNGIPLEIEARASVKKVYWYLDEKLIYQGSPGKLFSVNPTAGKHKVSFVDDQGSTGSVLFVVKQVGE